MNWIFWLFMIVAAAGNIYLTRKKNRSVLVWLILGLYTYFLSTIVLLFLKPRQKERINLAPFVILWPFLLVVSFANLPLLGVLFKPIPPELLSVFLWIICYLWFLIYLWAKHRSDFSRYLASAAVPLLLAVAFCLPISCIVRPPFRDGVKTIAKLEEYKKKNGRYPGNISQLGYQSLGEYSYDADKDSFSLIYRTGLFESGFYDSKAKKWRGDLPVGGVPYDIIGIDQL